MGAPVGNQNAASAFMWKQAILRALERRGAGDRLKALDDLAEKLLMNCDDGDISALRELGDRVEGKPPQAINLGGQDDNPLKTSVKLEFK